MTVRGNTRRLGLDGAAMRRAEAEALERRVLLSGTLGGTAWDDFDGDGLRDDGEPALPGVRVYIDADNDAAPDEGEASVVTDAQGGYAFNGVPDGRHFLRQALPAGRAPTYPGQAAPAITRTIEGINFMEEAEVNGGSFGIPAHPNGAVGPAHVLSVTRKSVEWHTKAGGQQNSQSLISFFSPVNGQSMYMPKAHYDPHAGRFVVIVTQGGASPRILLAVSDDADPNGTWHFAALDAGLTIDGLHTYVNYSAVGFDREAIYFCGAMNNDEPPGQPRQFRGMRLWVIAKEPLYAGGDPVATVHDPIAEAGLPARYIAQPAHVLGDAAPGGGTYLVAADHLSDDISVIRLTRPLTEPTFTVQTLSMDGAGGVPADGSPTRFPPAPQRGSQLPINTYIGAGSVTSAVWRGGALYAAMSVLPTSGPDAGQATVHWVKIDTSDPANLRLADQGSVGGEELGPGTFTFMPAVTVDAQGGMALNFSASGPSIYPGAYVTGRRADDPAGTVRPAAALAAGVDYYVRTFGNTWAPWGMSSAAVVDPSDASTFWAFNQYAISRGNSDLEPGVGEDGRWGTRWRSFTLPDVAPAAHWADMADGQPVFDLHFGSRRTSSTISGSVFHDVNADGARDEGEPGLAGRTVYLDRNNNGSLDGPTTGTQSVAGREFIPSNLLDRNDAVPISEQHPYYLNSAVPGTITDLNVRVTITHPRASDLEISLVSQDGARVPLVARVGDETGANFSNTVLDDEAAKGIGEGPAPYSGSFRPQSPLSAFDGLPAAGTWRLEVRDREVGETGTINAWSLDFTTSRPGEETAVTGEGGDYFFPGLPLGSHTVRQVLPEGWEQTAPAGNAAHAAVLSAAAADAAGRDFGSRQAAPPLSAVYVRGSTWAAPNPDTVTFMEYLEAKGLGDDVMGYRLLGPGRTAPAANPEDIIPWINVDQVVVRYATAPTGSVIPTPGVVSVAGRGSAYTVVSVDPIAGDPTAYVLSLAKPLGGGDPVTGVGPQPEQNGDLVTLGIAGAGPAGSPFIFRMKVLQGDVDHQGETGDTHTVLARDYSEVKKKFFKTTSSAVEGTDADYSPLHDVDASGSILARDYSEVKKRFFHALPGAASPVWVAPPPAETSAKVRGRRAPFWPSVGSGILGTPEGTEVLTDR